MLLPLALGGAQGPVEPLTHGRFLVVVSSAQAAGPLLLGLLVIRPNPSCPDVVLHEGFHVGGPLGTTTFAEDGKGDRGLSGPVCSLPIKIFAGPRQRVAHGPQSNFQSLGKAGRSRCEPSGGRPQTNPPGGVPGTPSGTGACINVRL